MICKSKLGTQGIDPVVTPEKLSTYLTISQHILEDRAARVERARKMVESGELLTPQAARDTARAILGLS